MNGHKSTFRIYGRPQITNISNLVKNNKTNYKTTHVILGHGFWSNDKKKTLSTSTFEGLDTHDLVAPLFGRQEHERLRAFAVPVDDKKTFNMPLQVFNLYEGSVQSTDSEPTLTTKYPAFTGIEVTPTIINENQLSVTLPPASGGFVDIIIANRAGYGKASVDLNQASDQTAYVNTTLAGTIQLSTSGMIVTGNDRDKDGVPNDEDAFPLDPKESVDTDGDGVGDNADDDDDGDGIIDRFDYFPKDPTEGTDTDGDGVGDNADDDDDNDGTPDADDAFPKDPTEDTDTDGDGVGDNADDDDDDDGTPDVDDAFPKDPTEDTDTDGDGTGDNADDDDDDDGTPDVDDAFPKDPTEDTDTDGDGTGDNADDDDDGDGTPDVDDTFPKDPTEDTDTDGDGTGDNADDDDDNDGTPDVDDAFPKDPTEDTDTDGDGVGDNEDTDDDNDGTPDVDDAFPKDPTEDTDTDGDGTGDNADDDDDGDGTPDVDDAFPKDPTEDTDTDGDGTGDNEDTDDDNDGVPDTDDAFPKDSTRFTAYIGCYTNDLDHPNLGQNGPEFSLGALQSESFACAYEKFYQLGYISDSEAYLQETGTNNVVTTQNCSGSGNDIPIKTSIYFRGADIDIDTKYNLTEIPRYQVFGNARAAHVVPRVYIYRLDGNGLEPDLANGLGRHNDLFEISSLNWQNSNEVSLNVTTPIDFSTANNYFVGEWCYKIVPTPDTDFDGDGIGDLDDPDDDNDGTPDVDDAFPKDPTEDTDTDGDGVGDNVDITRPENLRVDVTPDDIMISPYVEIVTTDVEVVLVPTWVYAGLSYSSFLENDTNTITLSLQPNIDLPAGQTIRLGGMTQFATPDNTALPISGPGSSVFGSSADWVQLTGDLTLTVAPGQIMSKSSINTITFDLTNPNSPLPIHQITLQSP